MRVHLTDEADADLESISDYVAERKPVAAVSLIGRLRTRFRLLAAMPRMGERRPDLGSGLRSFPHGNYVIIYRIDGNSLVVARIVHGARDIKSVL